VAAVLVNVHIVVIDMRRHIFVSPDQFGIYHMLKWKMLIDVIEQIGKIVLGYGIPSIGAFKWSVVVSVGQFYFIPPKEWFLVKEIKSL
jgi:hypothetical protein